MAKRKSKNNISMVGAIIVAALIGLALAMVMFYDSGTPLPPPANVEFTEEYDDSWGKLATPVARCGVTHILVKTDDSRSEEDAKELIDQIWAQYKTEPTKENWRELQKKHNEDTADIHKVYPIPGQWMPEFQETGKTTKVGFARICKTSYGYHLIRRES